MDKDKDEELARAQLVLEGRCPDCGHEYPSHSIVCLFNQASGDDNRDRLAKLRARIASSRLTGTIQQIAENKDGDV